MDLNAGVDVNCGRKDGRTDRQADNRTLISHLAKAGATKMASCKHGLQSLGIHTGIEGIVSPI